MSALKIQYNPNSAHRNVHVAEGPIDFGTWLCLGQGLDTELIDGIMVDRLAAKYPHEWINAWLLTLLRNYVGKLNLGEVLGSRTAVKITNYNGRLPDVLFVRAENISIIHEDAIYGIPDLAIEIVSSNDRPSDVIPLESDYRTVGIPEIVFIDPRKKQVRLVTKTEVGFEEQTLQSGRLEFRSLPGFWIEIEWLFSKSRPNELDVALQLLRDAGVNQP